MKMDRAARTKALATHNLIVTMEELARIREAIRSGTLLELALRRMRSHPRMTEILDDFKRYGRLMEPYDPVSKRSALLYTGPETRYRPEVVRFQRRLYERFDGPARDVLAVIPDPGMTPFAYSGLHVRSRAWVHKEYPDASVQFCTSSHLFGVVPEQLEETYPVAQCVYPANARGRSADVRMFIDTFGERYGTVLVLTGKECVSGNVELPLPDHVETVRALADHQLYRGARAQIPDGSRVKRSRKTKRLRAVYGPDGELIAALRASDLALIPKLSILEAMPIGVKTVVVDDDAAPFVREGRSAFCRFVDSADPGIGARDEVAVRDLKGSLLAEGTAQVSGREMEDLSAGVAVKVRESIKSGE
jgi:7-cyano-7-deazaguanine tRNA-ribosyltransferase